MVHKERCVCEICSCGKHHCGPAHKFKSTGKLDLKHQGDIYVASKASYVFPDSLNLFEGDTDLNTVVRKDFKGHLNADISRPKPTDQIELSSAKMESLTSTNVQFPAYDLSLSVAAEDVKKTSASLGQTEMSKVKLSTTTSYADHYPGKNLKFEKSLPAVHNDELKGPSGELDLSTINKSDYVNFKYGRPELNKISDNNVFGVSGKDRQSKTTTVREHYPGFKAEPAKQIKAKENGIEFGSDDRAKTTVYGEDFKRTQPKVRKSKRRGTEVEFGVDFDHVTSYKTQFEGKSGGKLAAASFKDELELFSGKQDLSTIVRSDFKGHDRVEVSRHRPKDQIEIPNEKMSMDTVTLGHFPAPVVTAEHVATVNAAGKAALSSTKAFDISNAMMNVKMSSDTSYKQQYDKKKLTKVEKFSFADEIPASTGDIDLATLHKSDFTKYSYGRPQIHKTKDNNVFGINYDMGRSGLAVESLPPSRASLTVDVDKVAKFKSAPTKVKAKKDETSYGQHFKAESGKTRSSKKIDPSVTFGGNFYGHTSYADHFKTKKCLVPTLDELDEYTFKDIKSGHKVYSINCGCPPKGACGCTPPPIATVKVA
ncbi:hypothetical protein ACHWQZ_G013386 [Mnemiopsis leidyi]